MKAIIVGAGIGGLTTALMLHQRGIACEIYEQADAVRELGVGINTLPHAILELKKLDLLERLDEAAIRTFELIYTNRLGQEIWREPRGIDAGYDVPQFSIHRGRLQSVIYKAVVERLGPDAIRTGARLGAFKQDEGGVTGWFFDRAGAHVATARGDILVGADGIHSTVRGALYPGEGPPVWNGLMLWRGATEWPAFLTGRSMIVAGGLSSKMVVYPIAEGWRQGIKLTTWAEDQRRGRPAAQGGLVAARKARGPDAARGALLDPAPQRPEAHRVDAGALGVSHVRPGPAAALDARPRDAPG
jgi:2-polyprenyl-6-methoxyphenol hydroxylase-like FAD-dependent oxidoreductase